MGPILALVTVSLAYTLKRTRRGRRRRRLLRVLRGVHLRPGVAQPQRLDLGGLDAPKDGHDFAELVADRQHAGVNDELDKVEVERRERQVELARDLGGEGGHEGLQQRAHDAQQVYAVERGNDGRRQTEALHTP